MIEVRANLQNYTTIIDESVNFNVTFYKLETDMELVDLKYTLEEDEIFVQIPQPVFDPELHQTDGADDSGDGDGGTVKYSVKMRNTDRVLVDLPEDAITLDKDTNQLKIKSDNKQHIGYNKIYITYEFQDYMALNSMATDFSLLILPSLNSEPGKFAVQP